MNVIMEGDCRGVMSALPEEYVDAIVCDPPYDLGFMGKAWDKTGVAFDVDTWKQAIRVLKPGGHLMAFGGTRTYHRMAVAIEDAGFEVRDMVQWLYGTGFPKSMDVGKAIDKAAGKEREVVGTKKSGLATGFTGNNVDAGPTQDEWRESGGPLGPGLAPITIAATPEAAQWEGWGTALKPACEPIVLARKPLGEKTVAGNVLRYGTGALNVDGTRVGTGKDVPASPSRTKGNVLSGSADGSLRNETGKEDGHNPDVGRWPANVIMDEEAGAMLDAQSGISKSSGGRTVKRSGGGNVGMGKKSEKSFTTDDPGFGDVGGASRFFYCAKASKSERNAGGTTNNHPTVKPISLMRYLIRLVTPPNGLVLDPFVGSGTTGIAAKLEGFNFIGIELDADYAAIARARIEHWE